MSLEVNVYFYNKSGRIDTRKLPVELTHDGELPRQIIFCYDSALNDEEVRFRFDPRKDWDNWASGAPPFRETIECTLVHGFGLTYMERELRTQAIKKLPSIEYNSLQQPWRVDPKHLSGAWEAVINPFDYQFSSGQDQPIKIPRKKKT